MKEISVITSKKRNEKVPFLINLINEYAIKEHKSVYVPLFAVQKNDYLSKLIALLSKEPYELIKTYLDPTLRVSHAQNKKINMEKVVSAIEKIRDSNLVLSRTKFLDETYLEYLFLYYTKYDCIIIEDFDAFLKNTLEDIDTIFKVIKKYCEETKGEVIIFMNEKELKEYKIPHNIKIGRLDNEIKITYNPKNFKIEEVN